MDTFQTKLGLEAHLRAQHEKLRDKIAAGQRSIANEMAAFSGIRSQAAMHAGLRMLNDILLNYFDTSVESAPSWIGPTLPENEVKLLYASELREVLYELAAPKAAYKPHPPSWEALEPLRQTLELRLANFLQRPLEVAEVGSSVEFRFEIDGTDANQDDDGASVVGNSICLYKGEILSAIDRLLPIVAASDDATLAVLVEPDLRTVRVQLEKIEPNIVILHEAGRSVAKSLRSSSKWDHTPSLQHACKTLSIALGII
jgi:hypothetical protein